MAKLNNNTRSILVFGSSGTPCELFVTLKLLHQVEHFNVTYVDDGFLTTDQKKNLLEYQTKFPCSIDFAPPEACKANHYDMCIALSVAFRYVSPRRYNPDNTALRGCGIDTSHPLWR